MIGLAIKHPVLTLIGIWLINGAVRGVVSSATGYDTLQIVLDTLKARQKAQDAKDKARASVTP